MKKFLLFSLLLLMGACSSVVWGKTKEIDGVTWTVNANGEITNCTGAVGDVVIPNVVDGDTVMGFDSYFNFKNNTTITSIDFSNATNIRSLSPEFCQYATELTRVNFGNYITSISNYAFDGCTKLTSAILPDCVTSIGAVAFRNCPLTEINVPANLTNIDIGVFTGCDSIQIVHWNASKDVPINAFSRKTKIMTVNFNNNDSIAIMKNAFTGCVNLQTVNFGNANIKSIGEYAFDSCTNLSSALLPDSVTKIGSVAFRNCTHLKSIRIPSKLLSIDFSNVFYNDAKIENIIWNASIDVPASMCQNDTVLKSFSSENNAKFKIGDYAFYGCSNLENADISPKATLGDYSFKNCTNLKNITIPTGNTSFSQGCFVGCKSIDTINWYANFGFPANEFSSSKDSLRVVNFKNDSNISIASSAFSGYGSLENVDFGEHISAIGDYTFDGCTKLSSALLPDSLKSIGLVAFRDCNSLDSLRIPAALSILDSTAFTNVSSIKYLEWNSNTISPFFFQNKTKLKTVIFGNKTDLAINSNTFFGCSSLDTVDLGEHIFSIGENAFRSTAITEVVIPITVQSIDNYAFRDCKQLNNVTFMPTKAPTFGQSGFSDYTISRRYNIPCSSYGSYSKAPNTPCNANNTIEKCGSETEPYTIGNINLDHNVVCDSATINRRIYSSYPAITFGGDYSLSTEKLTIEWTFDAHNFYYFTLPFDCAVEDISLNDKTIEANYFTCSWSEACSDLTYNYGGWQIVKHDENKYVNGKVGNSAYTAVLENETLKAGVGYAFCLLNPISDETGGTEVIATFTKNDSHSFNQRDGIAAPSSCTEGGATVKKGWNLYGNPFYWDIPLENYGVENGVNVLVPILVPNTTTGKLTFTPRAAGDVLHPNEMVFIQRGDNNGITILAAPAETSNSAPARYSNQRPIRLTLSHNDTRDDHTFIKSDVEASDNYVISEDCYKMKNDGKNQLYTMVNDTIETAFNCLNLEGRVRTIPVGLTIVNAGSFQIAIADGTNFMPGTVLKLRDTQTGAEYDLLNGPATLTLNKGIINDRYVIEVMDIPCDNKGISEVSDISAYVRDGKLIVEGIEANEAVRVYDAAGRLVTSFTATTDVVSLDLEVSGVYFVNVSGETIKIVY